MVAPALLAAAHQFPGVRGDGRRAILITAVAIAVYGGLAARMAPDPRLRYALPGFLALAAAGLVLAVVDLDLHRLPDAITLPAYPVLAGLLALASLLTGDWYALLRAAVACLVALALYAALAYAAPHGLGFGDVKLAGVLAMALGWQSWAAAVAGVAFGFAAGALASLTLLAVRRASWRTELPFGPSMLAGAFLAALWGDELAALYLAW
ncbi:MAG: prepilin peptidase [Micromonosporaceae bacterium]